MPEPTDEDRENVTTWSRGLLTDVAPSDELTSASRAIVTGTDPVLPTRFRVGEAAAAAMLAVGIGAARQWEDRGGKPQQLEIDVRAAATSLLSFAFLGSASMALARHAPPTVGLYRAGDGQWIHLHGGFPHLHDGTIALLGCEGEAPSIAAAVARWEAQRLEDALAERGLCGARLRSAAEWLAHPQGIALSTTPLIEIVRIADSPIEPLAARGAERPLGGVRILDLTRVLAGPTCARTLAAHGAEVLHVRSRKLPFIEPFVIDTNPGKRSCYLDLDDASDAEQLRRLVRGADVFSQGYRSGTFARRGLSPEELAALRPGIVVVSINCYGHQGPWAERPGWEQLAQTATGMAHEHGGTEAASIVPAAALDYTTGHLAALGALAALARRAREGGSWHIRVSLARTAMWLLSLPRTPPAAAPSGIDPTLLDEYGVEMQTAWGPMKRLGPILRMSETPPYWSAPPVPLGTDAAAWG